MDGGRWVGWKGRREDGGEEVTVCPRPVEVELGRLRWHVANESARTNGGACIP